jgi:two-component system, NtrC family, response regulator AtoC
MHTTKVDVRVIAATNSDLQQMVHDGTFREDLFYRLNVIPVQVPALRERREDIPLLAQHFLDRLSHETPSRGRVTLAQDAQQALMAFHWPGNVRQLENVMERSFALSPGRAQIEVDDLPDEFKARPTLSVTEGVPIDDSGVDFDQLVASFERDLIRRALDRSNGNKRLAADLLRIKRTTLIEKLKRLERS